MRPQVVHVAGKRVDRRQPLRFLPGWTTGCSEASALAGLVPRRPGTSTHLAPARWPVCFGKGRPEGWSYGFGSDRFVPRRVAGGGSSTGRRNSRPSMGFWLPRVAGQVQSSSCAGARRRKDDALGACDRTGLEVCVSGVWEESTQSSDLPYAALHQLLTHPRQEIRSPSRTQRDSLASTLGLSRGRAVGPLSDGASVSSRCFRTPHRDTGLLCAVDDAEWLDRASASGRFLRRSPAGFRGDSHALHLRGPGLDIGCFGAVSRGSISKGFRKSPLVSCSTGRSRNPRQWCPRPPGHRGRGNPLALIELAQLLAAEQLASWRPASASLGDRLEESLMRNVRGLSSDARSSSYSSLRSGAAIDLLRRAADGLGLSETAIDDAESVLRLGTPDHL